MALTVVTSWSPDGYQVYGKNFLNTFHRYWPEDCVPVVYVEELDPHTNGAEADWRLFQDTPFWQAFLDRHRGSARIAGRVPQRCWSPKEHHRGYSFRTDAYKFCHQVFALWDAVQSATTDFLCWFDGDVTFHAPVTPERIERLLPAGKDMAYLGRGAAHSEIGFQLYRLPQATHMVQDFVLWYAHDRFLELKEWHSAYLCDRARVDSKINGHNLTPKPGPSAVWNRSPLAAFSKHHKGQLKYV